MKLGFAVLLWAFSHSGLEAAVVVGAATELAAAIQNANLGGDKLILLQDGIYTLDEILWVGTDGVTVRSLSGNRNSAIIQGNGMAGYPTHIFNVAGSISLFRM